MFDREHFTWMSHRRIELQAKAKEILRDQTWRAQAACVGAPIKYFFFDRRGTKRRAMAYCIRCPVQFECLQYATYSPEEFGVWGGFDEEERARLKLKRKTDKQIRILIREENAKWRAKLRKST